MPISKVEVELREVRITRDFSVLRTVLSADEVSKILLDYVLSHELPGLGLQHHEQLESKVQPAIEYRYEEYSGFVVDVVFAEAP